MFLRCRSLGATGRPLQLLYHAASSILALREKWIFAPKWHPWIGPSHRSDSTPSLFRSTETRAGCRNSKGLAFGVLQFKHHAVPYSWEYFPPSCRSTRPVRGSWLCRFQVEGQHWEELFSSERRRFSSKGSETSPSVVAYQKTFVVPATSLAPCGRCTITTWTSSKCAVGLT